MNRQIGKSKTQINEVYYQLKFLCKTAKQNGIIPTDPAEDLIRPQAHKKEVRDAALIYASPRSSWGTLMSI